MPQAGSFDPMGQGRLSLTFQLEQMTSQENGWWNVRCGHFQRYTAQLQLVKECQLAE
jgi:hypothetical protein